MRRSSHRHLSVRAKKRTNFLFPVTRLPVQICHTDIVVQHGSFCLSRGSPAVPSWTRPDSSPREATANTRWYVQRRRCRQPALGKHRNIGHRQGRCPLGSWHFVLTQRRIPGQRQAASIEYDGLVCVHQNAVVEMPSHCPRKHDLFEIGTLLYEVLHGITVRNARDVLFDDRPLV